MKQLFRFFIPPLLLLGVAAAQQTRISVDARTVIRHINPWLYGINTARWDESLFPGATDQMLLTADRDAIAKVKASGVTLLKYPGGNDADHYIWNSPDNNTTEMDTDEYIAFCREVGAEPFITINFNESVELAAEWVRYCNVQRGYNVKLWEVGDEQWGWWAKGHAPPEQYAQKYIAFVKAMKAVDPSIRVATNVPLGPHPENWTERVLKAAGDYVDMLTFTYFPQQWGKENDDTLFASTPTFRKLFIELRNDVERVLGAKRAAEILYVNVGYNSVNHSPGPQTLQMVNALWTADMIGTMAETGVDIGCFWALHNYYPPRDGDFGYLSSDGSNTPRFTYYVFPMFVNHFGNNAIRVTSGDPAVAAYASTKGKSLSVLLISKDRIASREVTVSLSGFIGKKMEEWVLSETQKYVRVREARGTYDQFTTTLAPYSMHMIVLVSRDSVLPPPNLARLATATASSFSTIGPHFTPTSAIDGNLSTRWNSAAWTKSDGREEQWFQLSWTDPQQIGFLRIRWGESPATVYRVLVSDNATDWRTLQEVKEGRGGTEEFQFPPLKTRYLRIDGQLGTKGISAYSIRELEVYAQRPE